MNIDGNGEPGSTPRQRDNLRERSGVDEVSGPVRWLYRQWWIYLPGGLGLLLQASKDFREGLHPGDVWPGIVLGLLASGVGTLLLVNLYRERMHGRRSPE